ncbi:hypothetical protein cce_1119 [Crocosphaera subtropica ATCC 51142]|uniref:Uncharacterized protein n=1 Tax=Crocosphaera subtropica (strain ATCC 51142 / BH68) TaxID=43989 RepID=B1WU03_CROS5|nr:hypothetical protein cce_1119 [Crocosphaera subtropica ATCC 51142]
MFNKDQDNMVYFNIFQINFGLIKILPDFNLKYTNKIFQVQKILYF